MSPRSREVGGALRELARRGVAAFLNCRARLSGERVACVLVYHGVADTTGDPDREIVPAIGAATLARHLRLLARRYRVVSPSAIVAAAAARRRGGRLPLAITFDDDLASHATHASPLLRERGLPAAFFLCGSMIAGPLHRYWWEGLQAAADDGRLRAGDVPGADDELVGAACDGRPGAIHELARLVEELAPAVRDVVSKTLATDGAVERRLEPGDVQALVRDGFEIGFHTLRHDRLPPLDDTELAAALDDGRRELEHLVGRPLGTISYPHGRADTRVADATRAAGFSVAFLGGGPPIRPDDDPLLLSRHGPSFESTGILALQLARYLRAPRRD